MGAFFSTLDQMMFLFLCMLIGFLLSKLKILSEDADVLISRMENYVFVPALIINSFMTNCTLENLAGNAATVLYGILLLGISVAIALVLTPAFSRDKAEAGLYRYSLTVTNIGFMGNALVQGLMGEEVLFRFLMFTLPTNIFIYSVGVIWLTAGKRQFSLKLLLNPMFVSVIIGMVLGLTRCPLPSFVGKTISAYAACFSPLAMVLTGFVIAKFDILSLLKMGKIYVLTAVRIIAMPLLYLLLSGLLKVPQDIRVLMLFYSAMPLGLNTIVFPAAYGGDETPGAGMAVISNLVGIISVPLILSLVL